VAGARAQLSEQTDHDYDFTYQLEPLWKFHTGPVGYSLLTGAQVEWQSIDDNRLTANLPNITNIFAPVIPETSTAGLTFLRTPSNSGMMDDLRALYLSTYATDQIDVTDQWKVRLGVRQEHWYEGLTPQVFVPGRFDPNGNLFEPGVTESRIDTPASWSVGTLYKILPGLAPFVGASKSYLTNFNSETTQTGIYAPESGLEYEAGVKLSTLDDRFVLTVGGVRGLPQQRIHGKHSNDADPDLLQRSGQPRHRCRPAGQAVAAMDHPCQRDHADREPDGSAINAISGRQLAVGVPAHIFNIWTTYDFAIAGIKGFKVGTGLSYNDRTYANTGNTSWIPPSTVIDGMIDWSNHHWDAQFGIKNIGNVTYYTIAQSAGGYVGTPRTYYVKANWHY
jgi:iron complex outermembrane receptor protein